MRIILKLSWIEFFFRLLPETFIYIWGIHVIYRRSFNILKGIFLGIILSIIIFFVRYLPIYLGVHMIINIFLTISIMAITGIPIIKSIYSTLLLYFILSLGEFFNIAILNLFKVTTSFEILSPFEKCLYGIPSLIFLLLFIIIFNCILSIKEKGRYKKCL